MHNMKEWQKIELTDNCGHRTQETIRNNNKKISGMNTKLKRTQKVVTRKGCLKTKGKWKGRKL